MILLAESDDTIRISFERYLASRGFDLVVAKTADETKALLALHGDDVDIIVLDSDLAGRKSTALVEELRKISDKVRFILTTAWLEDSTPEPFTDDIVAAFMHKPFSPKELATVLALSRAKG
jgi:two-component system cell cycle sensor histidine kinase/response regulator CckA